MPYVVTHTSFPTRAVADTYELDREIRPHLPHGVQLLIPVEGRIAKIDLPNRQLIQIEPVTWGALAESAGVEPPRDWRDEEGRCRVLDAFNDDRVLAR